MSARRVAPPMRGTEGSWPGRHRGRCLCKHRHERGRHRCRSRTPAATCWRWFDTTAPSWKEVLVLAGCALARANAGARLDGVERGGRTAPFWRTSRWAPAGGAPDWRPCPRGFLTAQNSSPALTCIIGARRAWIALMISSVLIPCRYTLVVDTYECPSWRWITGSGTPSRASSTA